MIDQGFAGFTQTGHDIDDALRDTRFDRQLRDLDGGGRGDLRGLQHDGVARGQRWRRRHDIEEGRRIPRGDHADDADRLAKRVVQHALAGERNDRALDLVGQSAEIPQPVLRDGGLQAHLGEKLAVLGRFDGADPLGLARDLFAPDGQPLAAQYKSERP